MIPSQPHIASDPKGKHVPAPHHTRTSIQVELDYPVFLTNVPAVPLGRSMSLDYIGLPRYLGP